jgi:hypothetical protein
MSLIVYLILTANGWSYLTTNDGLVSTVACEQLRQQVADVYTGKIGNMKIICAPPILIRL